MYYIGSPPELLDRLKNTACKEYGPFAVVFVEISVLIVIDVLPVEIVLVVNEIDLHSRRQKGGHLDNERMVCIINNQIHTRQAYDLVKLIATLVDATVFRRKCSYFKFFAMNSLRDVTAKHRH